MNWIRNKYRIFVSYIEQYKERIPLSNFILMYLKTPLAVRIFLSLILLGSFHAVSYIIGFIILQSKAKNEVLSLITASQNPIDFTSNLYFYYAFVYLFITLITLLPFGGYLFYGRKLLKIIKRKTWLVIGILLWIIIGIAFFWGFLKSFVPLIPYYLFYASKNPSTWEGLIKNGPILQNSYLDLDVFQKEIFISLQSGNMAFMFLIFLFFVLRENTKLRTQHIDNILKLAHSDFQILLYIRYDWEILKNSTLIFHLRIKKGISLVSHILFICLIIFVGSFIFVSHTAYQLGGFGKNLAQFDTDLVSVDYNLNGQVKNVIGIRVYQDKNYVVIRDSQNSIHSIFTDQIHIQTK